MLTWRVPMMRRLPRLRWHDEDEGAPARVRSPPLEPAKTAKKPFSHVVSVVRRPVPELRPAGCLTALHGEQAMPIHACTLSGPRAASVGNRRPVRLRQPEGPLRHHSPVAEVHRVLPGGAGDGWTRRSKAAAHRIRNLRWDQLPAQGTSGRPRRVA